MKNRYHVECESKERNLESPNLASEGKINEIPAKDISHRLSFCDFYFFIFIQNDACAFHFQFSGKSKLHFTKKFVSRSGHCSLDARIVSVERIDM